MTATAAPALSPGRYVTVELRTYHIRPAHPTSPTPAQRDLLVYAANGRQPVARIRYGVIRWTSCTRVETDIAALLADPDAAAGRYAARTGRCARCNRSATGLDAAGLGIECRKDGHR